MRPISEQILPLATVPEHSLPLMTALAQAEPLLVGDYLFYRTGGALLAIGYPLTGQFSPEKFTNAVRDALTSTRASECHAIAPQMPADLQAEIEESDRFYVLGINAKIPTRLRNYAAVASKKLIVNSGTSFTPAHRRLWAEFLERNGGHMTGRVRELYARTPQAMIGGKLTFVDAHDDNGHLVATLLLDTNPARFLSYVLGAHSRQFYAPHAMDLLFLHMMEMAREQGKRFIHLGLGVNEGILRFKKKWGAVPSLPFVMANIPAKGGEELPHVGRAMALAVLRSGSGLSARQMLQDEPEQRPFAMLWQVQKNNRISWLGGTAHFFYYSFANSFRKLFSQVDNVIFEGPLDPDFMASVSAAGTKTPAGFVPLIAKLTEVEIVAIERMVNGTSGAFDRLLAAKTTSRTVDVRWYLAKSLPWHAFFTLWTGFLERLGWRQSVDMEAYNMAKDMGKNVIGMENLEEQLNSLNSLPEERALNFFRNVHTWPRRAKENLRSYLAGDLEFMMGSSAEFPTRTEHIVSHRDQRFRERMRPWLERGDSAVFVGSAHLVNLRSMLVEDGFSVRQRPFGIWPRLHLKWRDYRRPDEKVTW